jgi:hypothetical protein
MEEPAACIFRVDLTSRETVIRMFNATRTSKLTKKFMSKKQLVGGK